MRVEVNKPVGRVLLAAVNQTQLPDNVTPLSSYATDDYSVFLFKNPAGVFVGFVVRTDLDGWVAAYGNTELEVLRWLELNLGSYSFTIPPQTVVLS